MATSVENEIAIASYSGLWFLDIQSLKLKKERYLDGNFVNKMIELTNKTMVVSVWDTNSFYLIDRQKRQMVTIKHPCGEFRCWGIKKIDQNTLVVRDNFGLILVNILTK